MGRLIDADVLIKQIWKKHKEAEEMFDVCVDELKEVYCGIVATIDEQPTAYDVDKVVEGLEEEKENIASEAYCRTKHYDENNCEHKDCFKCCAEHLIEIVRKGGVHE